MDRQDKVVVTRKSTHQTVSLSEAANITSTKASTIQRHLEDHGFFDTKYFRIARILDQFDPSDHPDNKDNPIHRIAIIRKTR